MTKKHGNKGKTMAKRNFYSQTEIKEFHRIVRSLTKNALTELVGDEGGTTNRVVCPFSKIKGLSTNPSVGSIFQRLFHSNLFIRHLECSGTEAQCVWPSHGT